MSSSDVVKNMGLMGVKTEVVVDEDNLDDAKIICHIPITRSDII